MVAVSLACKSDSSTGSTSELQSLFIYGGKMNTRICIICKNNFTPKSSQSKMCGDICRKIHNKNERHVYHLSHYQKAKTFKYCIICGSQFKILNQNHKCCSDNCSKIMRGDYMKKFHSSPVGLLSSRLHHHKRKAIKNAGVFNKKGMREFLKYYSHKKIYKCYWCNKKIKRKEMNIDHVNPLSKKGNHEMGNMAISCRKCNASKSAKEVSLWVQEINQKEGQLILAI